MLVLTRKAMEGVTLFDRAGNTLGRISIQSIAGNRCRVGFEFAESVRVVRDEIANPPLVTTDIDSASIPGAFA